MSRAICRCMIFTPSFLALADAKDRSTGDLSDRAATGIHHLFRRDVLAQ